MTTLSDVDKANELLQKDGRAAASTKAFAAAATGYLHTLAQPQQPPAPTPIVGGVGLYQLGGSLASCTHLDDRTYATVIGDWDDADLLAKVSGAGFVYTVVAGTPGADPARYTVLDPANPQPYIDAVVVWRSRYGFKGVFLDNCLSSVPGLLGALAKVSDALRPHGVLIAANIGSFVSGDPNSDTGALWIAFAQQAAPSLDYGMLENWQQVSDNGTVYAGKLRLRGEKWYNHFDDWQRCPGAQLGAMKFMGVTYGPPAPGASIAGRFYGRAALLTAPGVKPDAVFVYSTPKGDPYHPEWTKPSPNPIIFPTAGTATL